MPLPEEVARSLVRKRKDELMHLSEEQRNEVVTKMVDHLRQQPPEKLIQMISSRPGGLSPEVEQELHKAQSVDIAYEHAPIYERYGSQGSFPKPDTTDIRHEADLQRAGVATRESLPAGNIEYGFAADNAEAVRAKLSEHFKEPITVFRSGGKQGDILYIDPTDHVVKKANPDWRGKVGHGITVTGDIAGTTIGGLLGAAFTKNPAGVVAFEAAGSTIGTTGGEFIRLVIGNALGVNNLSFEQIVDKAVDEGLFSGAVTLATGGLIAATKGIRNFLKGGIFTKEEALKYGLSTQQADAVLAEVNRILKGEGKQVKGTLFQRSEDALVGGTEARVSRRVEDARKFAQRAKEDQEALAAAAEKVTQPTTERAGRDVQEAVASRLAKRTAQGQRVVAQNTRELDEQLTRISKTRKESVGEPTRSIILEKRQVADDAVNGAWDDVRALGGFVDETQSFGIKIPAGKSVAALRRIEGRRAKTSTTNVGKSRLYGKKTGPADLEDFNSEISALKSEIRAASKNKQFGTPQVREMQMAVHAMEKDRRLALMKAGREDLVRAIDKAEKKTFEFHDTYNRSLIGDLTATDEKGVFKIQSKEFVDRVLKGDKKEASQLLDVIGDQPTLMTHWKEGMADAYKRDVVDKIKPFKPGAKLSREQQAEFNRRTKEWIASRKDILDQFFTPEELARVAKTGDLAVTVKKQIAQMNDIIKKSEKQWGSGKLRSLDPDNVVKFLTGESGGFVRPSGEAVQMSLNKINFVKSATKEYPGVWKKLQREYSTSIRNRVIDSQTGYLRPRQIADYVKDNSRQIKAIMGEQYYNDLVSLSKAAKILSRKPVPLKEETEAVGAFKQAIRVFAAPLTPRGRAFTAIDLFHTKAGHDVIARALLDPDTMRDVAKLSEHPRLSREVAELAASIGLLTGGE